MKFYFAGSIQGGRDKVEVYVIINKLLEKYGNVLDKHVANPNVFKLEKGVTSEEIYNQDIAWIKECDLLIAEVTVPSLGVGYEVSYAEHIGNKVICLCEDGIKTSAMIDGNKYFDLIRYKDDNDLLNKLEKKLQSINNKN